MIDVTVDIIGANARQTGEVQTFSNLLLLPIWFQISAMKPFHAKSTVDQLADYLRGGY
jgi:hypothetical protein